MRLYDINNIQQIIHWKLFWLSASYNSLGFMSLQCTKVHGVATENTNYWIKRNHNHMVSTNEMRLQ